MAATTHDINDLKRRMQGAMGVLKQELAGLRTGRASASLLETWIDEAERRTWFLFEATRRGESPK